MKVHGSRTRTNRSTPRQNRAQLPRLVRASAAGKVDAVAVGADRVAANGDTANKIGTLQLAIAAAHYAIPFLVVAPLTSCDPEVRRVFCFVDPAEVPINPFRKGNCTRSFGEIS